MDNEEYNAKIQADEKAPKRSIRRLATNAGKSAGVLAVIFMFIIIIQQLNMVNDPDYIPSIFGYTYLNVLSGSMEPELSVNDLMVGRKIDTAEGLEVGDIITYEYMHMLVTHRIIRVNEDGSLVTQGDANNAEDLASVTEDMLIADYSFKIPLAGYVISKLQDPMFLIMLWAIAMYAIIREFIGEIKKGKQVKRGKQQAKENESFKNS